MRDIDDWVFEFERIAATRLKEIFDLRATLRDDLPEIVAAAKAAGCRYVQLNTNGFRLAEDPGYVKALAEAGLSFVFLQFDGTEEAIYEPLRGRRSWP